MSIKEIKNLKNYIYPNGIYSNIRANSTLIKKYFPEIYESIKNNYGINLYMLLHNIIEIPECKNPNCNNRVKLKNIGAGFRKYCSNKCIGAHQKIDKKFSKKISDIHLRKNILNKKFPNIKKQIIIDKNNKNYYIIKKYCKHGNIRLYTSTFLKLYNEKICLCQRCKNEVIKKYVPKEEEIKEFYQNFNNFYNNYRYLFNEKWFKRFYPKEYKIIIYWSNHIKNISLSERIYLFKNKLKNKPLCKNCKEKETHFNSSTLSYTHFCDSYACIKNTSVGEIELYNFLKSINNNTIHKYYIGKNEFDIKVDNSLIEFNGLYWHSDEIIQDKNYHYNKWKLANENNFNLINIWEDDWYNKQDIIKSILQNKLHINQEKIYARKCKIQIVDGKETKKFLENNHIQSWSNSSINLGLFYDNELVSLMTFGKRKLNKSKENYYEIIRFCNKLNISVIGGASKLWNYFINNYNINYVISYSSCDLFSGKLYEKLNFKNIGHTGVGFWWVKGKQKYNRNNFMKYKLIKEGENPLLTADEIMRKRGYSKIWNAGNLKYVFINKIYEIN